MKLTYIKQSGFVMEGDGFSILMDYYEDSPEMYVHTRFLQYPGKLYILASHSHWDHFNPEILAWQEKRPDIQYVFTEEIRTQQLAFPHNVVFLKKGEEWCDQRMCVKAFGSTDIGGSFLIDVEGKRVFHAGDLNNWHWKAESTPEEVLEAETNYLKELDEIALYTDYVDLVLFPIDPRQGEDYTLGAKQFIDRIKTGTFVPMHCWQEYDKANAFKKCVRERGVEFREIRG